MALNEKNPPALTNLPLFAIDLELQSMAKVMSTIPWLQKSWGRAKIMNTKVIGKEGFAPMVYLDRKEYYSVMPNDSFKSYSFWGINSAARIIDSPGNNISTKLLAEVNAFVVVWVNLKRINRNNDFLFTQELIKEVLQKLSFSSQFSPGTVMDEKVEDIFKGYTLSPTHRDLLMYPFQAFRIEGKLTFQYDLCDPIGSGATNPDYEMITKIAGEALGANRIVKVINNQAFIFDPMDENNYGLAYGLTLNASAMGGNIDIAVFGEVVNTGAYTPNTEYFAGLSGIPTDNTTGLKIVQPIGKSSDGNRLFLDIDSGIITQP